MAPKTPKPKTSANEPVPEIAVAVKYGAGAFVFVVLAILWYVTTPGPLNRASRTLTKNFGLTNVAVDLARDDSGRPVLVTKQQVQANQPLLSIPQGAIVDLRSLSETAIGRMIQYDNASIANAVAQEHKLHQNSFNVITFAFYLASEKRKGSSSKLAPFFEVLPDPTSTALYWPEDTFACLDNSVKMEHQELVRTLNGSVALAKALCDVAEDEVGCKGKPFTEEEMKYAISVYVQTNYQDQALMPLLSFASHDNTKPTVTPQFDQGKGEGEGKLHFVASQPMAKGEKVVVPFGRGPNVYFTAFGVFDAKQARGVELGLQLPSTDEIVQRACLQNVAELQFGANGRPRQGLVDCMTVLIAPDAIRAKLSKNIPKYRTPQMIAHAWGNLTVAAESMLANEGADAALCAAAKSTPLVEAAKEYVKWRRQVLTTNAQFSEKQMAEKYAAAGLPMPVRGEAPGGANAEQEL
jgi:hypothetical protein